MPHVKLALVKVTPTDGEDATSYLISRTQPQFGSVSRAVLFDTLTEVALKADTLPEGVYRVDHLLVVPPPNPPQLP